MFGRLLRFLFALPVALAATAGLYYFRFSELMNGKCDACATEAQTKVAEMPSSWPQWAEPIWVTIVDFWPPEPVDPSNSYTRRDKAVSQPPRPSECTDCGQISRKKIREDALQLSAYGTPDEFRIREIRPTYPIACHDKGVSSGHVIIEYDLSPEGAASNARVVESSDQCFNATALQTMSRMRFEPATDKTGRPTWRRGARQTVNFELDE